MPRFPVGMSALELVPRLVKLHSKIASIKLVEYRLAPTFGEIERKTKISFEQGLTRRLRHGGGNIRTHTVSEDCVTLEELGRIVEALRKDSGLAVSSQVILEAENEAHIPLIDFGCRRSHENLARVVIAMRAIDSGGGVILNSGNSYHYYGRSLLTNREWREFLGKCLLVERLVDVRNLGHCLIDGEAALRISRDRRGRDPKVAATVSAPV